MAYSGDRGWQGTWNRFTQTGQQLHEEQKLREKAQSGALPEQVKNQKAKDVHSTPQRATTRSEQTASTQTHITHESEADGFTLVDAQHGFQPDAPPPAPRRPTQLEDEQEDNEEVGGEWITPANITQHKNKALGLVTEESQPDTGGKSSRRRRGKKGGGGPISVACMTGDFAVQNVLLQMGLRLVSVDGMRIERVKSWVLRCHACYKYVVAHSPTGFARTQNANSVHRAATPPCCAHRSAQGHPAKAVRGCRYT